MTAPGPEQDLAVAQVQAIIENAQKLGLVWVLRPATVTSASPLMAVQDGDSEPIAHTSLLGSVNADERVYVLVVPPSGNYIVGNALSAPTMRLRDTSSPSINSGAQTTITWNTSDEQTNGVFITVPGTTITVPITGIWAVSYNTRIDTSTGTRNFIAINVTTAITGQPAIWRSNWGPGEGLDQVAFTAPFLAGDTYTATIFQNSGGPLTVTFASLFMTRVAGWIP